MARCLHRWTDPAPPRSGGLGPYICGRPADHKGAHARQGADGSFAAWDSDGELLMAAQSIQERGDAAQWLPPGPVAVEDP